MENSFWPQQRKDLEDLSALESLPRFVRAGLFYFKKYTNVRRQGFWQQMAVCELLKTRGNEFFNQNDTEEAIREYEQAVSIFRYIFAKGKTQKSEDIRLEDLEYVNFEGEDEKAKSLIRNLKVALYNNLAACYIRVEDYKNAKFACDEALLLDPTQTKALYRRAKAITSDVNAGLEEYNLGLEDLKKAYALVPQNSTILAAFNQIKQDIKRLKSEYEKCKGNFYQRNEKGRSSQSDLSAKKDENDDNSTVVTQSQRKGSNDDINTASSEDGRMEDSQTLNECYESLSKSNLESQSVFNQKIGKLGKILEAKCHEISETSKKDKSMVVTNGLKEHLKKAMAALHRLEELATLDFSNPTRSTKDAAKKLGLNVNGGSLQEELKIIQTKSLQEIKIFIDELNTTAKILNNNEDLVYSKGSPEESVRVKASTSSGPNTNKTTNNYFINNNYFSETDTLFQEFSRLNESIRVIESFKNQKGKPGANLHDPQVLADLAKGFSKFDRAGKRAKFVRIMNFVIVIVAITLFLATIILQSRHSNLVPQETKDI